MVGKHLSKITDDPELSANAKDNAETEALINWFETSGQKPNKDQRTQAEVDKAATKRTLVSEKKRKALEQMGEYEEGVTNKPPGSGKNWELEDYRSFHSKGGSEPIRRRSSSPEPGLPKERIAELGKIVDEQIQKRKVAKLGKTEESPNKKMKIPLPGE